MLCFQTVAVFTLNGITEVDVRNCGSKFKDLLVFISVSIYKLLPWKLKHHQTNPRGWL